jgi:hypothetical protein
VRVDEWRREIGLEPLQQYLKRTELSDMNLQKGRYNGNRYGN